jgi:ubiquitin-like 1-activating enzyme E1 A
MSTSQENGQDQGALSELESQRYDRQIRVWGAEAQSKIQTSKVLVCGVKGLNTEVMKNIVLAGVNIVLQDDALVRAADLSTSFFLSQEDIGKNAAEAAYAKIQDLNKFASVGVETRPLDALDDKYFRDFKVIILGETLEAQALRINGICRSEEPHIPMFWNGVFGNEAWFVSDFGQTFEYKLDPPKQHETKSMSFPALQGVLEKKLSTAVSRFFPLSRTFVKSRILCKYRSMHRANGIATAPATDDADYARLCTAVADTMSAHDLAVDLFSEDEVRHLLMTESCAPVSICSVLGSFLAQEVIKAVSASGEPGYNVFIMDGHEMSVKAMPIVP